MSAALLEVENLSVAFPTQASTARVVDDVSVTVRAGESIGIVGESGSGKSVTLLSILRLLPQSATVSGRILFDGTDHAVYRTPHHPYTQALLSAAPEPDPDKASRQIVLQGDAASPMDHHAGCAFQSRCPIATDICLRPRSEPMAIGTHHAVACHHARPNPIPV